MRVHRLIASSLMFVALAWAGDDGSILVTPEGVQIKTLVPPPIDCTVKVQKGDTVRCACKGERLPHFF